MSEPQQPGWYPDHTQPGTERWHDGQQWTPATRASGAAALTPAKKRRKWPWIVAGVIVLLVVIGVASGGKKKSPTAASADATVTTTPASSPAPVKTKPKPPAPAAAKVLLRISGNGTKNSPNFTVAASQWTIAYTYSCPSQVAIFQIYLWQGDTPVGVPANTNTPSGNDSTTEHGAGTYYLQMNTTCTWTVTVTG